MIRNPEIFRQLEENFIKNESPLTEPLTFKQSLKLYESMWHEAETLGVFPPEDPLEGIEKDIRLAGILNSCLKNL